MKITYAKLRDGDWGGGMIPDTQYENFGEQS